MSCLKQVNERLHGAVVSGESPADTHTPHTTSEVSKQSLHASARELAAESDYPPRGLPNTLSQKPRLKSASQHIASRARAAGSAVSAARSA